MRRSSVRSRPAPPDSSLSRNAAIAAAVVALIALGWWLWPSPEPRNADSRGKTVIAFGDSLTAGYGAPEGEDYPSKLSTLAGTAVLNAGVTGDTTEAALRRIEADVLRREPRLVIVGLGGNDYLRGVGIEQTEANLRTIVRRIHDAGAMVILLGFRFPGFRVDYEGMYERIAEEEQCLLIPDMLDGILSDPSLKSDQIHPNGRGYAVMAERVAKPLRRALER
jgi:acyl-CoA thioesterase I